MASFEQKFTVAIVSEFPEHSAAINGGVESAVWNLVQGLTAFANLKLYVIAPGGSSSCVDPLPGVKVIRYSASPLPGFLGYWTTQRLKIRKILRTLSPDIVHYQALAGQAVFSKFPSVLTIHGIAEQDLKYKDKPFKFFRRLVVRMVETYSRKRIDKLIVINPYVRQFLHESANFKQIPNAIDERFFEVVSKPVNRELLYVGRISELKNVLGMLKVFRLVVERLPDAHLSIIGNAEEEAYLSHCKEFVGSSGLGANVTFLGSKDVNEIRTHLGVSSCLLLASKQENAPMVIAEAMAAGVPVLASDCGGISYMLEDGRSGFLVNWDEPHSVVEKLELILTDDSTRDGMASYAKTLSEQYRMESVAERTRDYYLEILNSEKQEM